MTMRKMTTLVPKRRKKDAEISRVTRKGDGRPVRLKFVLVNVE
jgi:hypothetical protein